MNPPAETFNPTIQFDSIIGQSKAKELLARAVDRRKISHAYLFRGPNGVGKKSLALAFAALINCQRPSGWNSCGTCQSCRKFISGNHPDLLIVRPDGSFIKINQVRELKKSLHFSPLEAAYRVILLTEVETMRREAANSLLKILEEPPPGTVMILAVNHGNNILPTILSRCQVVPFFALPTSALAEKLAAEFGVSTEEAFSLAVVAEGSLGRARLLQEKNFLSLRTTCAETVLSFAPGSAAAVQPILSLAADLAALKSDLPALLDILKSWFRDAIVLRAADQAEIMNPDIMPTIRAAAQRWNLAQLSDRIKKIGQAKKQLDRNCNRNLVCETLFFSLL